MAGFIHAKTLLRCIVLYFFNAGCARLRSLYCEYSAEAIIYMNEALSMLAPAINSTYHYSILRIIVFSIQSTDVRYYKETYLQNIKGTKMHAQRIETNMKKLADFDLDHLTLIKECLFPRFRRNLEKAAGFLLSVPTEMRPPQLYMHILEDVDDPISPIECCANELSS